MILQPRWEGRCCELLDKGEGYFAKLPWSCAGEVLQAVNENSKLNSLLIRHCH